MLVPVGSCPFAVTISMSGNFMVLNSLSYLLGVNISLLLCAGTVSMFTVNIRSITMIVCRVIIVIERCLIVINVA